MLENCQSVEKRALEQVLITSVRRMAYGTLFFKLGEFARYPFFFLHEFMTILMQCINII